MSAAEEEVTFNAPVKRAVKKSKRKTAPARAAAPKSEAPYPGMTHTACADTCNAKGCAISGSSYCAHPVKGGLQSADKGNPAALKRYQKAVAQLDVKLDPDRFKGA
jgi:hypothetical protein